jgi:hypothetical protein
MVVIYQIAALETIDRPMNKICDTQHYFLLLSWFPKHDKIASLFCYRFHHSETARNTIQEREKFYSLVQLCYVVVAVVAEEATTVICISNGSSSLALVMRQFSNNTTMSRHARATVHLLVAMIPDVYAAKANTSCFAIAQTVLDISCSPCQPFSIQLDRACVDRPRFVLIFQWLLRASSCKWSWNRTTGFCKCFG